jgi:hypothetical protein
MSSLQEFNENFEKFQSIYDEVLQSLSKGVELESTDGDEVIFHESLVYLRK